MRIEFLAETATGLGHKKSHPQYSIALPTLILAAGQITIHQIPPGVMVFHGASNTPNGTPPPPPSGVFVLGHDSNVMIICPEIQDFVLDFFCWPAVVWS